MKRLLVLLLLAAAVAGFLYWRNGQGPTGVAGMYSGYVEADYVMVASAVGGKLTRLEVARGDRVATGAPLFALDDVNERGARDEAAARLGQAEAQLADLLIGRRPAEIGQILAQRVQAQAMLRASEAEFQRQTQLRATGASSIKQLDDARMARDRDRAQVDSINAEIEVAKLPGRDDQIRAAQAAVAASRAAVAQADWKLGQKVGMAPAAASVVDTLYRPGETVPAGLPVVKLLPPGNVKLRFFVPEDRVAAIAVGQALRVSCDGCGAAIPARVTFISPQAEFTPPVIYSREQRARLVFLVEARTDERAEALRVGQPVDVTSLEVKRAEP